MKFRIFLICYLTSIISWSQNSPMVGNVAASGIDINTSIGGFISEIAANEVSEKGSVYLFDDWMPSKVKIDGKHYAGIKLNYNLLNGKFEYKDGNRIMQIESRNIEEVQDAFDNIFVESKNFKLFEGSQLLGICKLSAPKNKWNLVTHYSLSITEANYVASLDVGNKERTYGKKDVSYLLSGVTLYEVVGNRKKFAAQFGDQAEMVLAEIKNQSINLKDHADLIRLIRFLNDKL